MSDPCWIAMKTMAFGVNLVFEKFPQKEDDGTSGKAIVFSNYKVQAEILNCLIWEMLDFKTTISEKELQKKETKQKTKKQIRNISQRMKLQSIVSKKWMSSILSKISPRQSEL